MAGVTVEDILKPADWSRKGVFQRFYYRLMHSTTYGSTVRKTISLKSHIELETKLSEVLNGPGHAMAASYLESYEEGEVEILTRPNPLTHVNSVGFVA